MRKCKKKQKEETNGRRAMGAMVMVKFLVFKKDSIEAEKDKDWMMDIRGS